MPCVYSPVSTMVWIPATLVGRGRGFFKPLG